MPSGFSVDPARSTTQKSDDLLRRDLPRSQACKLTVLLVLIPQVPLSSATVSAFAVVGGDAAASSSDTTATAVVTAYTAAAAATVRAAVRW